MGECLSIIVIGCLSIVLFCNIIFMVYTNCYKGQTPNIFFSNVLARNYGPSQIVLLLCIYHMIIILWLSTYRQFLYETAVDNTPSFSLQSNDPISICSFNNKLCAYINNPICKYLLPAQIIVSRQHKTGHMLSHRIQSTIHDWCGKKRMPFYNDNNNKSKNDIKLETLYLKDIDSFSKIKQLLHLSLNTRNAIIFQFTRLPLNTIMSGYEYHKITNENWAIQSLTILGRRLGPLIEIFPTTQILLNNSITNNVNDLIKILKNNPYQRSKFCYNLPYFLQVNWTKSTYNYSLEFALKHSLKMRGWYIKIDDSDYGIFWEFIRYYNCEWYHMYLKHKLFKKLKLKTDLNINHISFTLDSFFREDQFEKNINLILDMLNIIDNEKNNRILNKYYLNSNESINITKGRNDLYETLKTIRSIPDNHQTKGTYNKMLLMNKLFRAHKNACLTLKNLTLFMNFTWDFPEQC